MNFVIGPLLHKCVVVFLDDILVYCKSMIDHVQHLREGVFVAQETQTLFKVVQMFFCTRQFGISGACGQPSGHSYRPNQSSNCSRLTNTHLRQGCP